MRTGIIARKIGSSRVFRDDGSHVPVTLLLVDSCQVLGHRTQDQHGYNALQIGAGEKQANRANKPSRGNFAKSKVTPKEKLVEFRISSDAFIEVGSELSASHFVTGQKVDVLGTSIGKGFAGAMKRHNFAGLRATHGVSISHRSHGSTGHCQEPGKVFKGKNMAGHMGDASITVQNLEIVSTDDDKGLIVIKGAVPGSKGGWVRVSDAIKSSTPDGVPFPGGLKGNNATEDSHADQSDPTNNSSEGDVEST